MKTVAYGALGIVLAALAFAAPVFGAGGEDGDAGAGPASTLELSYDLYAGGIPLGKVAMSARVQGKDYKDEFHLGNEGHRQYVLAVQGRSLVERYGRRRPPSSPRSMIPFSLNRQAKRQQVKLTFGADGPSSLYSDPVYPVSDHPVSDSQQKMTLDPLSAMVFLATSTMANEQKPCGLLAPIYDGRRRYDVVLNFVKKADVHMDNNLYSGSALVCEIHYNQIAGYNQTLVEQGKKLPKIYTWMISAQSAFQSQPPPIWCRLRIWAEVRIWRRRRGRFPGQTGWHFHRQRQLRKRPPRRNMKRPDSILCATTTN